MNYTKHMFDHWPEYLSYHMMSRRMKTMSQSCHALVSDKRNTLNISRVLFVLLNYLTQAKLWLVQSYMIGYITAVPSIKFRVMQSPLGGFAQNDLFSCILLTGNVIWYCNHTPKPSPVLIIPSFHGVTTLTPKAKKISILVRYEMDAFTLMHHVLKLPLPVIVENEGVHFEETCIRNWRLEISSQLSLV